MSLKLEDVTKRFGGLVALDKLTFEVRRRRDPGAHRPQRRRQDHVHQRHLRVLSGHQRPHNLFDDRDITRAEVAPDRRAGHRPDVPVVGALHGPAGHRQRRTWPCTWLRHASLEEAAATAVGRKEEQALRRRRRRSSTAWVWAQSRTELTRNLPHGQQRCLGVCLALATDPKLLLLDEPLTGMNANEIADMVSLIREHPRRRARRSSSWSTTWARS